MYFLLKNDPEFTFMLRKIPLFTAKKSGRQEIDGNEDRGYGLFTARDYEGNQVIDVYAGFDITSQMVHRTEYAHQFGSDCTIQLDNEDFCFMGIQFFNDPYYPLYEKGETPDESDKLYNVVSMLLVYCNYCKKWPIRRVRSVVPAFSWPLHQFTVSVSGMDTPISLARVLESRRKERNEEYLRATSLGKDAIM